VTRTVEEVGRHCAGSKLDRRPLGRLGGVDDEEHAGSPARVFMDGGRHGMGKGFAAREGKVSRGLAGELLNEILFEVRVRGGPLYQLEASVIERSRKRAQRSVARRNPRPHRDARSVTSGSR